VGSLWVWGAAPRSRAGTPGRAGTGAGLGEVQRGPRGRRAWGVSCAALPELGSLGSPGVNPGLAASRDLSLQGGEEVVMCP